MVRPDLVKRVDPELLRQELAPLAAAFLSFLVVLHRPGVVERPKANFGMNLEHAFGNVRVRTQTNVPLPDFRKDAPRLHSDSVAIGLVAVANSLVEGAAEHMRERIARPLAEVKRVDALAVREAEELFVRRGFDYQDAELAAARSRHTEKARAGDAAAGKEVAEIREHQRGIATQRDAAIARMRRAPELIDVGHVAFLAHALVVPSSRPEDRKHRDDAIEAIAMQFAIVHEQASGAAVKDVSKPYLARAAGLNEYPGFDIYSKRPGNEERAIEVKGRASVGEIELTENEWARACNERGRYWLYVVFDCGTPTPRLYRIRDPFGEVIAKAKGGVVIDAEAVLRVAV